MINAAIVGLGGWARVLVNSEQVFGSAGTAEIREERHFEARPMNGEAEAIDFGPFDKERAELDAFADAITGSAPYPLPNDQAIHGVAVFEEILESAVSGETVAVV